MPAPPQRPGMAGAPLGNGGGAPHEPVVPRYLLGCPGQGGVGRLGGEAEPCAWGPAAPWRPPNPFPGTFYAPSPRDCPGDSALKCLPAPKIAFGGGCVRLPSSGLLWQYGTVSSSTRHELLVYCRVSENKGWYAPCVYCRVSWCCRHCTMNGNKSLHPCCMQATQIYFIFI